MQLTLLPVEACTYGTCGSQLHGKTSVQSRVLAPLPPFRHCRSRHDLRVAAVASETSTSASSGLTSSSLLGPSLEASGPTLSGQPSMSQEDISKALDTVELPAQITVNYEPLRDALRAGEYEKADDITRALLIELAGEEAQQRGWVYFTEVQFIADADLLALDQLWAASSGGKFGYAVQRELWLQNRKQWGRFFQVINWVQGENNVYRKWPMEFTYDLTATKGHLPLTNALRGTRLFEAIMEHPAFATQKTDKPNWAQ